MDTTSTQPEQPTTVAQAARCLYDVLREANPELYDLPENVSDWTYWEDLVRSLQVVDPEAKTQWAVQWWAGGPVDRALNEDHARSWALRTSSVPVSRKVTPWVEATL